jgi:hypothetical protein
MKQYVPRLDPATIQLEADRTWGGKLDKAATTLIEELMINGVRITSRYNKGQRIRPDGRRDFRDV